MVGKILKQFSVDTGISQKDVAARLSYSPQRINNYYRDQADPPFEFYERFRLEFNVDLKRQVEAELKGKSAGVTSHNPIPVYDLELRHIPELDFFNHSELVTYYVDAPLYNDCSAFVMVFGEAMQPAFKQTDLVAVRRVQNLDTIPLGEPFLIVTKEQRLIRYVRANEADPKKSFTLKAENPNFDNIVIKKTDIEFLFQIKGKMTRR